MALHVAEYLKHPAVRDSELVRGEVRVMTPTGGIHGVVIVNIVRRLSSFVYAHDLGLLFSESTGFELPNLPDTVRAPDVSFVRRERLPAAGVPEAFLKLAPDLAVEVLSPSDRASEVAERVKDLQVAGTPLIWIVDARRRCVRAVTPGAAERVVRAGESLDGGDVLPGFTCLVDHLFEGLGAATK